jgi:hypothetical protein
LNLFDTGTSTFNANWRADGPGTHVPTFASRAFDSIEFLFVDVEPGTGERGGLLEPSSSFLFFLDTNARGYNRSGHYVVDSSLSFCCPDSVTINGGSERFATLAPVAEPETYALMLIGLVSLWWVFTTSRRS